MGKCKTKSIKAELGILRHIQKLFRNLTYSEPEEIQNPGLFRTLTYLELDAYPQPFQASATEHFAEIGNTFNYTFFI